MGGGGEQDAGDGRADDVPDALDDTLAGDDSGLCAGLLDVLALLSDVGAARWLLHRAGYLALIAAPGGYGFHEPFAGEVIDAALGELAETGLVTIDEALSGDAGDGDADHRDDDNLDGDDVDGDDLDDAAFDTVTVDPDAGRITLARHVAAGAIAELGARACALLDEAARSGAPIDYALLADGMTSCWDHLLPYLGAADDELVKDLLSMRSGGLHALGFYPEGNEAGIVEFGERLVADYELALGPGHPDAWETRRTMAMVYERCGRNEEAVDGFERLRADKERALPAGDSEILDTRSDLANGYLHAKRYPEAVREYTELLADYERALGPEHNQTLLARASLGAACTEVGRVAEGIQLMEAAIPGLAALFGPDDPAVAGYRDVIADARAQAAG